MAAGLSHYDDEGSGVDILSEKRAGGYRKIVMRNGRLIGFILIGDTSGAGLLLNRMKRGDEVPRRLWNLLLSSGSLGSLLPPNLGYRHGSIFS
jgi:assimilatory nitrate reductase electron transfer subunit